ncbi:MAG: fibronectin type III domain-containing protein [Luteolibacter sp.]
MSICHRFLKRSLIALRSILLIWVVLLATHPVEAQSYNLKQVVIKGGGFVTGIVTHPNMPGLMYCRTDVGGAYRWNATNDSWIPLQDFLGPTNEEFGLFGVESIALDPQDANRLYMTCGWLGAGRLNEVWTSTDQGASFTRVTAPFTMEANSDGRGNGERLAVDPNLGSTLFNGTRRDGLWKSVNYGASWSKVTSFPVNTTANNVGLVFVEFIKSSGVNGSATPEIWVGLSQGGNNLYRSTNGGASWSVVPNGANSAYMPHRASQDGLGNMYVTFNDGPGPNNVGTGSVRKINLTTLASTDVTPPTGQGGFGGVSVDKQNPSTLVVSTMDRWWPHDEVYRSTNGGTTWKALYEGATIDASSAPWINFGYATPPVPHWIDDIKIDPFNSNRVYHISGRGIYSSYNLTATTPSWEFRSDGIEEMGVWGGGSALCSPPSGALFFSALGDIGGFAHQNPDVSPAKEDHYNPVYDSNTSVDFAESNPSIVVRTHYGASRGSRSTDSGKTWTDFPTHPSAADINPGVISISADGTRLVWASPGYPAAYSTNNGATWSQCGGNITPTNIWEQPLLFSDRVNSSKFYLYMPSTGVVHLSTDGGANFVAGPTVSTWCESMRTVYGQEGHIWISCIDGDSSKAGLWRSTNSGVSFTKVSGVQNAQSIGFGRTASGSGYPVLYMSGQVNNVWGIFRSEDLAASWIRLNDDQHQYGIVSQITGDPKIYGRCYFGGRGLLYGDIGLNAVGTINGNNRTILEATGNSVDYATFASNLATAFANNTGGVWNFDGPSFGLNSGDSITLKYGTSLTKSLVLNLTEGAGGGGINQANVAGEATSGYFVLGLGGTGATRTFTPDKPLLTVGIFNTDRNDASRIPVLTVTYQDNTTASTSGANADNVYFHGLSGTAANPIVSFALSQNNFVRYDDLAFIVASLPAPTNLTAAPGSGQIALSWNAVSGATGYTVQRSAVSGGPYTTVATVTGTSFTNTGLANGTTYYYVVSAVNSSGESGNSAQASAIPQPPAPSAPIGLAATGGNAQVALTWNISSGATSYNVKRATVNGGPYSTITSVTGAGFTDSSLANGTTYYYVVSASNAGGESSNSAQASATPQAPAPSAPAGLAAAGGNTQVALTWSASAGATSYNIKRATVNGGPYSTITSVTGTSFTNTGLANGTTYYYVVSAVNPGGESANSNQASATPQVPAPPSPTGLVAAGGNAQVALTWNTASGATSYNVKRSTTSGSGYSTITNITGISFTDTGLANGTTYYYVVSALNVGGESANSTQASATTSVPSIPSPWVTADIGAVAATGSASASGGTFAVTGSGADIWNSADEFRYVYQPSSGNCEMIAQVSSVQNTDPWAKAGVMIRESTAAGAIYAAVFITPGNGVTFQRRTSTGGTTVNTVVTGVTAPRYVRLERATNNSFRAYYSSNGTSWTQIGSNQTISMASSATMGLAVTSHNDGTLCTSTIANITATP